MKCLKEKYGVGIFQINDELTTANRKWVEEFCETLGKEDLRIFFIILSSRVDNVDEDLLLKLKNAGCLMINYGYESGSEKILKEIRKGVDREQALKTALLTRKVGIKNVPEIIIGFPSETEGTVNETIDFLKRIDTYPVSINTPIPFPQTPLWDTAVEKGLITEKEEFVLNYRRAVFVNFTGMPDWKLKQLVYKTQFYVELNYLLNRRKYVEYVICFIKSVFFIHLRTLIPEPFIEALKKARAAASL